MNIAIENNKIADRNSMLNIRLANNYKLIARYKETEKIIVEGGS